MQYSRAVQRIPLPLLHGMHGDEALLRPLLLLSVAVQASAS
jgi:hypothetical protein